MVENKDENNEREIETNESLLDNEFKKNDKLDDEKFNKKISYKSNYVFMLIFGVIILLALFCYGKYTGSAILSSPKLIYEVDFNNPETLDKINLNDIPLMEEEKYGNVAIFDGKKYMFSTEKLELDAKKGFNVIVNAYTNDNIDKNHLGLFSTNIEDGTKGFRMRYRDFEDADRLYIIIGGVMDYGIFEDGSCYQQWCTYAFTFKPNGIVLIYLNGELIKEFKVNKNIVVNDFVNVGNDISINNVVFNGKIANIRIYDGVLSNGEMKKLAEIPI